jgi:hypothetical protein
MGLVSDRIHQFTQSSAINSQLTLDDIASIRISGKYVGSSFINPQLVLLDAGMKLYKFNSYPSLMPDAQENVTGWWSAYHAYDVDPGWNAKTNLARCLGVSIRELGRVTSAITESWNSCEYLVVIALKVDIWGIYGRYSQMLRNDGTGSRMITGGAGPAGSIKPEGKLNTLHLPGGGRQFFIPNLKQDYYNFVRFESLVSQ